MAWGLRVDPGEAVGAVQPGTAQDVPAGRQSAGSQKEGSAKERSLDLPPESNIKDISQTDSSCPITTGNTDSIYFLVSLVFIHSNKLFLSLAISVNFGGKNIKNSVKS